MTLENNDPVAIPDSEPETESDDLLARQEASLRKGKEKAVLITDSDSDSDDSPNPHHFEEFLMLQEEGMNKKLEIKTGDENQQHKKRKFVDDDTSEGLKKSEGRSVIMDAKKYQDFMKLLPLPKQSTPGLSFNTWQGLVEGMMDRYNQPLHYLTHCQVRAWDVSRFGDRDEEKPMEYVIHPRRGEAAVWVVEEFNRKCVSFEYLGSLWDSYVRDSIFKDYVMPILKLC